MRSDCSWIIILKRKNISYHVIIMTSGKVHKLIYLYRTITHLYQQKYSSTYYKVKMNNKLLFIWRTTTIIIFTQEHRKWYYNIDLEVATRQFSIKYMYGHQGDKIKYNSLSTKEKWNVDEDLIPISYTAIPINTYVVSSLFAIYAKNKYFHH